MPLLLSSNQPGGNVGGSGGRGVGESSSSISGRSLQQQHRHQRQRHLQCSEDLIRNHHHHDSLPLPRPLPWRRPRCSLCERRGASETPPSGTAVTHGRLTSLRLDSGSQAMALLMSSITCALTLALALSLSASQGASLPYAALPRSASVTAVSLGTAAAAWRGENALGRAGTQQQRQRERQREQLWRRQQQEQQQGKASHEQTQEQQEQPEQQQQPQQQQKQSQRRQQRHQQIWRQQLLRQKITRQQLLRKQGVRMEKRLDSKSDSNGISFVAINGSSRCLDGSPPAYYFRPGFGNGTYQWIVYLPGGGWCVGITDCAMRATTRFGSSYLWPSPANSSAQKMKASVGFNGMLSSDPVSNPDFYNWNVAVVVYCDGGAYLGQHGRVQVNRTRIFSQGRPMLKAVVEDLMWQQGMCFAQRVVLAGCSAGGQSLAVSTCDWFATQMLPTTNTKCIVDAGLFVDKRDDRGKWSFRGLMTRMMNFHWSSLSLNRRCRQANADKVWRCLFPEVTLPFVKTPYFLVNNLYDYAALSILLHRGQRNVPLGESILPCLRSAAGLKACTPFQQRYILLHGGALKKIVAGVLAESRAEAGGRPGRVGSFVVKGVGHCSLTTAQWNKLTLRGKTLRRAVTEWVLQK